MPFDFKAATTLMLVSKPAVPLIKGWNRLEGRPRAVDFERALRAEVRDALWFLTRQWQFGEFKGEDAASPVEARTLVRAAPFTRYAPRNGTAVAYQREVPLETRVECEPVPADLITHVQITRYFFALLARQPNLAAIRALYLDAGAYALTEAAIEGYLDPDPRLDDDARQILSLAATRVLDGVKLLAEVEDGRHATRVDGFATLNDTERAALKQAGADLLTWFRRLYRVPAGPSDAAWAARFLEYQFACATQGPQSPQSVLVADQYTQGHLDWFAFDVDAATPAAIPAPEAPPAEAPPEQHALSFIPAPVSFSGMPSHRYWEFENRKTEFADIDANTTDVAKLLLTEFALVYGNDWCVIPYVVDVGSFCELPGLLVRDDFGETTLVRAAGRGPNDPWQRWSMFTLATTGQDRQADVRLLVVPALSKLVESGPLEQVLFLRDEMANMVWAVEKVVPAATGSGANGYDVARAAAAAPAPPALHPTIARARYLLGTDVPHNWHPFIPVHVPGSTRSVQLQRARLPGPVREIYGRVLAVPSPYYVNEEEVPRAGKSVTRTFQRARWLDGRTFVWLGRRVTTGRGEGSSGLAFDQVTDLKDETT
jgi:hypothetical protein